MQRSHTSQVSILTAKAQALYNAEKYQEALKYYNMAIELNPTSAVLYVQRAQCHSDCKNFLYANIDNRLAEIFGQAKSSFSESSKCTFSPDYYCGLARDHNADRSYNEAIECCTQAIKTDPKHIYAYYIRAFSYLSNHEWLKALLDYQSVLALQKLFPTTLDAAAKQIVINNTGLVWLRLEKLDEAIDSFTLSIAEDPTDGIVYYNRGMAYQQKGNVAVAEAIVDFTKAIELSIDEASTALKELLNPLSKEEFFKIIQTIPSEETQKMILKEGIENKQSIFGQKFWEQRSIAMPKLTRSRSLLFEANNYYQELLKRGHRRLPSESKLEPLSPLPSPIPNKRTPTEKYPSRWPFGRSPDESVTKKNDARPDLPRSLTPGKSDLSA